MQAKAGLPHPQKRQVPVRLILERPLETIERVGESPLNEEQLGVCVFFAGLADGIRRVHGDKKSENLEMEEIKAIREKLSEMHGDIKKVMEYSNMLRFETALESS